MYTLCSLSFMYRWSITYSIIWSDACRPPTVYVLYPHWLETIDAPALVVNAASQSLPLVDGACHCMFEGVDAKLYPSYVYSGFLLKKLVQLGCITQGSLVAITNQSFSLKYQTFQQLRISWVCRSLQLLMYGSSFVHGATTHKVKNGN